MCDGGVPTVAREEGFQSAWRISAARSRNASRDRQRRCSDLERSRDQTSDGQAPSISRDPTGSEGRRALYVADVVAARAQSEAPLEPERGQSDIGGWLVDRVAGAGGGKQALVAGKITRASLQLRGERRRSQVPPIYHRGGFMFLYRRSHLALIPRHDPFTKATTSGET